MFPQRLLKPSLTRAQQGPFNGIRNQTRRLYDSLKGDVFGRALRRKPRPQAHRGRRSTGRQAAPRDPPNRGDSPTSEGRERARFSHERPSTADPGEREQMRAVQRGGDPPQRRRPVVVLPSVRLAGAAAPVGPSSEGHATTVRPDKQGAPVRGAGRAPRTGPGSAARQIKTVCRYLQVPHSSAT